MKKPTTSVIYYLYSSFGNVHGIDEFISYGEIDGDGYWNRYLEIRADGTALRYGTEHEADYQGMLPEGQWDEAEAKNPEYGTLTLISAALFESAWSNTKCANYKLHKK